jgi:hypothetical protein
MSLVIAPFITTRVGPQFKKIELANKTRLECYETPTIGTFIFGIAVAIFPVFFLNMLILHNRFAEIFAEAKASDTLLQTIAQEFFVMLLVLGIFSCLSFVSLWMMFGWKGVKFDLTSGEGLSWWRVLFIKREKKFRLADYLCVEAVRDGGNWRTGPRYTVRLMGPEASYVISSRGPGLSYVRIGSFYNLFQAHEIATELGEFLKMEVRKLS